MRLPFLRRHEVELEPDADYIQPGPMSRSVPPIAWIMENEPWAQEFTPDMYPAHLRTIRSVWRLRMVPNQTWVVKKKLATARGHTRVAEVGSFSDFPTTDQIRDHVLEQYGGGEYEIWALRPSPPQKLWITHIPGPAVEPAAIGNEKAARALSPKEAFEANIYQQAAADPDLMARLAVKRIHEMFGLAPEQPPPKPDADEALLQRFLHENPQLAIKINAARIAKKLGVKVKDILGGEQDDEEDEEESFRKEVRRAAMAEVRARLRGEGRQGGTEGGFGSALVGLLSRVDPNKALDALSHLLPTPGVAAAGAGAEVAQSTATAQAQAQLPPPAAEAATAQAQTPAQAQCPAPEARYDHLFAAEERTALLLGRWREYPPAADAKEALERFRRLLGIPEPVSWLMAVDWAELGRRLALPVPEFAAWLVRAKDERWRALFKLLAHAHPVTLLLVLRRAADLPIIRGTPLEQAASRLLTQEGITYITLAMALCHELQAQIAKQEGAAGGTNGADGEDSDSDSSSMEEPPVTFVESGA